jgi:hypothetical protein
MGGCAAKNRHAPGETAPLIPKTARSPYEPHLAVARRYFPHTATSGPSVVSGVTPHETVLSVR